MTEPTLLPSVKAKLKELGFSDSPNPAMAATMHAARDVAKALADRLDNNTFWDGGDDIDYTGCGGDFLAYLTRMIADDCDLDTCTTFLNELANVDPDLTSTEGWEDWTQDMHVAANGGFSSPILTAIQGCNLQ